MGDGVILDAERDALFPETTLKNCSLCTIRKGRRETVREAIDEPPGSIRISVNDGVVLLDDKVTGFTQKQLTGVLAWWIRGSCDVIDGMEVVPDQPDSDEEPGKAVRNVLKEDPLMNDERIHGVVRQSIVILEGEASSGSQKKMTEFDAWYAFGVDKVINHLEIQP